MNRFLQSYVNAYKGLSTESWMLSLVMLLNRIGGMVIPFLTVYLVTDLKFSTQQAGFVMSCFGFGGLIGSVVGGWLTDKIGAFWIQFFSLLFAAPIFVIIQSLHGVIAVSISVLCLSFINECFRPANSAAISMYAKPGNLTRSFSLNRLAINLGFSFGPALGGFLATISYAWLFYGNSVASFVAAIVFFLYFFKRKREKQPSFAGEENETAFHLGNAGSPYFDRWFIIFSVFCFLYACVFFQLIIILPMFYELELHLSQSLIGSLLAFNGVVVFLTEMPVVKWIETKLNIYYCLTLGALFLFLSFLLLFFFPSLFICFLSMLFLSISELLVMPFMSTIAAKRSQSHNRGAYMGLQGLAVALAFVVMPTTATLLIANYSFHFLWLVNLFFLFIVMLGFLWIKRKMPVSD